MRDVIEHWCGEDHRVQLVGEPALAAFKDCSASRIF